MLQTVETLKFLLLYKSVSQVIRFLHSDYHGFPMNRGNLSDRRVIVTSTEYRVTSTEYRVPSTVAGSTSVSVKSFVMVRSFRHHGWVYLLVVRCFCVRNGDCECVFVAVWFGSSNRSRLVPFRVRILHFCWRSWMGRSRQLEVGCICWM